MFATNTLAKEKAKVVKPRHVCTHDKRIREEKERGCKWVTRGKYKVKECPPKKEGK